MAKKTDKGGSKHKPEKLTIKSVAKHKPEKSIFDVRDTELTGFFLRVRPNGKKAYFYSYKTREGKRCTRSIGKASDITAPQARDIAQTISFEVAQGIDVNQRDKQAKRDAEAHSLKLFNTYLENEYKSNRLDQRRSGKDAYQKLKRSFDHLGKKKLEDITPWEIRKWIKAELEAGRSEHTIRRNLAELKTMINAAVETGHADKNQLSGMKLDKPESNEVYRFLSPEERERLFNALDQREAKMRAERMSANTWRIQRGYDLYPEIGADQFADYLKPMVVTALNTGLRRGELFKLRWADVNLSKRQITVTSSSGKSKKARHIPINDILLNVLNKWLKQNKGKEHVFTAKEDAPLTTVKKSWGALMEAANIEKFRFHDMRHDFASQLVMKRVDLYTVKELMGHSTIQVTERYAHLDPEVLERAVRLLDS